MQVVNDFALPNVAMPSEQASHGQDGSIQAIAYIPSPRSRFSSWSFATDSPGFQLESGNSLPR